MNNLGIRQARNQIISFLSGLPFDLEVKRLLLKDVYEEVKQAADLQVEREFKALNESLQKAKEESANGTGLATSGMANVDKQAEHSDTDKPDESEPTD